MLAFACIASMCIRAWPCPSAAETRSPSSHVQCSPQVWPACLTPASSAVSRAGKHRLIGFHSASAAGVTGGCASGTREAFQEPLRAGRRRSLSATRTHSLCVFQAVSSCRHKATHTFLFVCTSRHSNSHHDLIPLPGVGRSPRLTPRGCHQPRRTPILD